MKKIWTAPAYLHETLFHQLLDQHQSETLDNVAVVPPSALLKQPIISESQVLEQAYARIRNVKDSCPHFTKMIDNPSFLKQLTSFRREMEEYNIPLDHLPVEDDFQIELKILIESFYDLPVSSLHKIQFLESSSDLSFVTMIPQYHSSLFDFFVSEHMIECGAQQKEKEDIKPLCFGRTALNRRQEIEACAQHIINNNLKPKDINIILCDPSSDQKVLQLIFERYGIPFGFVTSSSSSQIVRLFLSIVRFIQKPDLNSLLEFLHAGYYSTEHFDSLVNYIELFVENYHEIFNPLTHVSQIFASGILLDEREKQKLELLEEYAEQARQQIQLKFNDSPFKSAYDFCRLHTLSQQQDELSVLHQIKTILEEHAQVIDHPDYEELICFEIQNLMKTRSDSIINSVCVSDLTHPVFTRKHSYVLGCVQSSFPNFKGCSGIFDEDYVQKVEGYPTKTERQRFNAVQTSWIFTSGHEIIFSAFCADYEGKGRQMSVEIESRLNTKPESWTLHQNHNRHKLNFSISEQTAHELFLKNGKLHGSISSFEKWFNCPASYYLSYGLKLKNQKLPEFNIAMMGTLQHAVLEEILLKYGKNIYELGLIDLIQIVDEIFDPVIELYKKQRSLLHATKERCILNMSLIFEFLADMEQNTDFEPHSFEKNFRLNLLNDEKAPVVLQGIIDRIDITHDMLRILDYKSSHKTLSITKAQSGLQLQLLTYLYVASTLLKKTAAGCYYVSMKNDDIHAEVSKVDGRKFEIIDPEEGQEKELWTKSHRLDGLTFVDTNMLDFDGTHIKNFKNGKPSKIYSIEDLTGFVHTIYQYLSQQVSSGNISLTPTEDACTFCETASVCRFRTLKVKSIVPDDLTSHFFKEVKKP